MDFNFDVDKMIASVAQALEKAGHEATEDQFIQIANALDRGMPGVIQILGRGLLEQWRAEAVNAGPWGGKYANAIKMKTDGNGVEIYIDEDITDKTSNKKNIMFAKMMEEGVKSWSIKDALLKSEKAKISHDGIKYIIVPFPIATPRKEGQGHMQAKFGKREMTQEMYKIVKSGGRLDSGTIMSGDKEVNVAGLTKYTTRQFHSQYGIFRCITKDSPGWQFPGVPRTPVLQKVLDKIQKEINELVFEFIENTILEYMT